MASISFNSDDVRALRNATVRHVVAGDDVMPGMAVLSGANGRFVPSYGDADRHRCEGIALNEAANGQPLAVCTQGRVYFGSVLFVGEAYAVTGSINPGDICPLRDNGGDNNYMCFLGFAISSTTLMLSIVPSGVANPP